MAVAAPPRCVRLFVTSDILPCSLYSESPLSCRPQPRGSGGDGAPRKDTRQDRPPPRTVETVRGTVIQAYS